MRPSPQELSTSSLTQLLTSAFHTVWPNKSRNSHNFFGFIEEKLQNEIRHHLFVLVLDHTSQYQTWQLYLIADHKLSESVLEESNVTLIRLEVDLSEKLQKLFPCNSIHTCLKTERRSNKLAKLQRLYFRQVPLLVFKLYIYL